MFDARSIRVLLALSLSVGLSSLTRAQCLDWRAFPLLGKETSGIVDLVRVHDDGTGPALYVIGNLKAPDDPYRTVKLLRWKNGAFSELPGNLTGTVRTMETLDDGTGPALYVGGFSLTVQGTPVGGLVRWNGTSWSTFGGGVGSGVSALASYDDGTGPALYAGGSFTTAGGAPIAKLARWNGTNWSTVATGNELQFHNIIAIAGFDDGSGPALFLGSQSTSGFLRYQGGVWSSPITTTSFFNVGSMTVGDVGNGTQLFLEFGSSDPAFNGVRVWTGGQAQQVGATSTIGSALRILDDGSGPKLHAAGNGTPAVSVWDGSNWSGIPGVFVFGCSGNLSPTGAKSMEVFDSGQGPRLVAGGLWSDMAAGHNLNEWTGTQWSPIGPPSEGLGGGIRALHVFDDGSGPSLYAGGDFCFFDSTRTFELARWDGSGWNTVFLPGFTHDRYITAMTTYTTSSGPRLVIGCANSGVEFVNGQSYATVTFNDPISNVFALQELAGDLYVGGVFTYFGGVASPNLARLTPTGPAALGGGPTAGANGAVNALALFDDGSGPTLFAGGSFSSINGTPLNSIGRLNNGTTTWSPLGSGLNGLCDALVAFDDGTGPALYAAGTFTAAGGVAAARVAKWKNGTWSAVGAGFAQQVLTLNVFDDGSGPALYAGGNFTASGPTPVKYIAKWNGVSWSTVGGGVDASVWALQPFDDGTGPQMFVGGSFQHAANAQSKSIAAWRACEGPISRYCFGDGTVAACPCGNQGLAARGCDNSLATGGARMNANGTTNPDTIELYLAGLIPGTAAMLFQGDSALSAPLGLGDGLLCAGGNIRRLEVAFSAGGTLGFPSFGGPSISTQSAAAGDPLVPGDVRGYQAWYRDADPSFCTSATSNVSNAVRIVW